MYWWRESLSIFDKNWIQVKLSLFCFVLFLVLNFLGKNLNKRMSRTGRVSGATWRLVDRLCNAEKVICDVSTFKVSNSTFLIVYLPVLCVFCAYLHTLPAILPGVSSFR